MRIKISLLLILTCCSITQAQYEKGSEYCSAKKISGKTGMLNKDNFSAE